MMTPASISPSDGCISPTLRRFCVSTIAFLNAWGLLRYNLVTNDGERFVARDAYAYIEDLAQRISEPALTSAARDDVS